MLTNRHVWIPLLTWSLGCLTFSLLVVTLSADSNLHFIAIGFCVLAGVCSFTYLWLKALALLFLSFKKWVWSAILLGLICILIVIFFMFLPIALGNGLGFLNNGSSHIDCYINGKKVTTTKSICLELNQEVQNKQKSNETVNTPSVVVTNTNPLITCISAQCGNRQVTQSACNSSVCCKIGEKWKWANSQAECDSAQRTAEIQKQQETDRKMQESEDRWSAIEEQREIDQKESLSDCLLRAGISKSNCQSGCYTYLNNDLQDKCINGCESSYQSDVNFCQSLYGSN